MPTGKFREEWRVGRGLSPLSVAGSGIRQPYFNKVLSLFGSSLIGYWPMDEAVGATVAVDYSGQSNNGAYTATVLGQPGIGDGRTCPLLDGTAGFNNIYSAALNTDFNNQTGMLAAWIKVANIGVWTDGTTRRVATIRVDSNNFVFINRTTTNNQFSAGYVAGGTNKQVVYTPGTTVGDAWFHVAIVWNKPGDAVNTFFNGVQSGTQTGLGVWGAGGLAATFTVIGASVTTPLNVWSGYIAHVVLTNNAESISAMKELSVI